MKLREYIILCEGGEVGRVKARHGRDAKRQAIAAGFRNFSIRWAANWFGRRKGDE